MNRSVTRSAAISVALHAVLLAALVLLVRLGPSDGTSLSGATVQWIELSVQWEPGAEQTPRAAAEEPEPPVEERVEVEAPELVAEREEPAPTPEPAPSEPEPAAEPLAQTSPPTATEPTAQAHEPLEPAASTAPAEATVAAADEADPAATPTVPPDAVRAEPVATPGEITLASLPPETPEADAASAPPADAPEAAQETLAAATAVPAAPIPELERAMLAERIADLAKDDGRLIDGAELEWQHDGQRYSATVAHVPAQDDMALDALVVAVSTEHNGERLSTEMRLQRLAFSHFAHFVDRWDPDVQIHDDQINGRFHSNSEINVARNDGVQPRFLGKVTTARGINTSSSPQRVRRDEVFLGGLETRVGRIALPPQALAGMPEESGPVHEFGEDTRIEFRADGTFSWQPVEGPGPERRERLAPDATYLLGGEDVRLHVRGVVNGKVLVYSADDIVIEDDLTYADDPREPGADDYLGLVSEKNVEIAPPDVTGPGDLTVHAAIYAKRRFAVTRFTARESGTLAIYGSVTAGSVTATEPRYGTKLEFDERFAAARPPRFPVTGRFELADWDAAWRSAPLGEEEGELAGGVDGSAPQAVQGAANAEDGAPVANTAARE